MPLSETTRKRIKASVEATEKLATDMRGRGAPGPSIGRAFPALITGNASLAANRWKYAWKEAYWDGDSIVELPGGISGTLTGNYALNLTEAANTGSGLRGNGVDESGASYPAGFDLKPAPTNWPVMMMMSMSKQGVFRAIFQYENADDGVCS